MIQPIPVATWACLKINQVTNAQFVQVFPELLDTTTQGRTGVFYIQHFTVANNVEMLVTPFDGDTPVKPEYAPLYISFSLN